MSEVRYKVTVFDNIAARYRFTIDAYKTELYSLIPIFITECSKLLRDNAPQITTQPATFSV